MCGIVGIIGREPVAGHLLEALKRLEYRGYDSAGVATVDHGALGRRRAEGKLAALEKRLACEPLAGNIGIGHTRWATHGKPTESNAHPHATDRVAVAHNGIIENFRELRERLIKNGAKFGSETDTEVVAHLVTEEMKKGKPPVEAVAASLKQLRGAFALAFLFAGEDDLMIGARKGSPLAIGYGDGEMYLGSDAIALAPFTDTISYLEDGDWAEVSHTGVKIHDEQGRKVERAVIKSTASAQMVDKGNFKHFMAKEIHEQPEVVGHTLARYIDMTIEKVVLPGQLPFDWKKLKRLSLSACGTAFYAGLVAKYWFERFAKLPVEIDIASEFRYREAPLEQGDLAIFISQSGETADTLATLRYAKQHQQHVLSVVNVPTSTIARESDVVMPTLAGPEIGVASTKAFTCQLAVLACLAIAAGRARGELSAEDEQKLVHALIEVPRLMVEALKLEPQIERLAQDLAKVRDVLYLGRGTSFPIALEGSLGSRPDRPAVTGLIALLAALGFVLARWQVWAHGNIGRFILVGHHFASSAQLPHGIPVAPTYGYDGQFFYRLALNPLNFNHTAYGITMDRPYRYMRIGYPAVTWLFSLGQHAAVPVVLVAVNIAAIGAMGYLGAVFARA